ncbi:hypothetical protein NP233_g4491 [Leucocoprinus birnbaumii]|uniref:NACHT domain-containing protein n=1 Tax=Leucocoprinus birnbaumii TaxID=56174 RepID=A0AAD5VUL4_9AGAR|nr:hypothetical protein NP233_g4491 [Leucocoprinus birnbaumii]
MGTCSHLTTAQRSNGIFASAHHFSLSHPNFYEVTHNVSVTAAGMDLQYLISHTLKGAEFDSSERDPPPRCHPGTRYVIVQALRAWRSRNAPSERILWLHGPAGVGKSAIMQTVVELEAELCSTTVGATVFLSRLNGRDDPGRLLPTIAYGLATRIPAYRTYILSRLSEDPQIVNKAMSEQFRQFITTPIGEMCLLNDAQISIYVDGLDELRGETSQCRVIELIRTFSVRFPAISLLWFIASRPEYHIRREFSHGSTSLQAEWREVQVPVNSPDSCRDVGRYLREKFTEIRQQHTELFPASLRQWPTESQFFHIARSASGHFAFASTAIRFIAGDCGYGNPISQLNVILDMTSGVKLLNAPYGSEAYPLAALDSLYVKIMDGVPAEISSVTKLLLGATILREPDRPLFVVANMLNLEQHQVYHAVQRLYSVLQVPSPEAATLGKLTMHHASLGDFLTDPSRSKQHFIDLFKTRHALIKGALRILQIYQTANGERTSCFPFMDFNGTEIISPTAISYAWSDNRWDKHLFGYASHYLISSWDSHVTAVNSQMILNAFEVFPWNKLGGLFLTEDSGIDGYGLVRLFAWMRYLAPIEARNHLVKLSSEFDDSFVDRISPNGPILYARYFPLKKSNEALRFRGWSSMGVLDDANMIKWQHNPYLGQFKIERFQGRPKLPEGQLKEIFGKPFGHPEVAILKDFWAIIEGEWIGNGIPLLFIPLKS